MKIVSTSKHIKLFIFLAVGVFSVFVCVIAPMGKDIFINNNILIALIPTPLFLFLFFAFYTHVYRYFYTIEFKDEEFIFRRLGRVKKVKYTEVTQILKCNLPYRDCIHQLIKIKTKNGAKIRFCIEHLQVKDKWNVIYILTDKTNLEIIGKRGYL